jgi:hypothetical protein
MATSLAGHASPQVANLERRLVLRRGLSLGALTLLSGCNVTDGEGVQKVLWAMSRWNDRAQAWLFDSNRLAPEYPGSMITKDFPFNAFYGRDEIPVVERDGAKVKVIAGVFDKTSGAVTGGSTDPIYWDVALPSGKVFSQ